jgi:hypothetical protein
VIFVIRVVLGGFIVFGKFLAPCVGVLLLGNPRYIFTPPALGHMYII